MRIAIVGVALTAALPALAQTADQVADDFVPSTLNQPGKEYFTKLEHKHGKAKALTVLAHKLGRAVYYMLSREQAFDLQRFVSA